MVEIFKKILKVENFWKRDVVHFAAQFTDISISLGFFFKLETNLFLLSDLFKDLSLRSQRTGVINDGIVNFFIVLMTEFSELDLKSNYGLVGNVMIVAGEFRSVAFHFEMREEGVFALMSKHMSDVLIDVFFVDMFQRLDRPEELHDGFLLDGLHSDKLSQVFGFERWPIFGFWDVFVEDLLKVRNKLFFHLFDGKTGAKNGIDSV